MRAVRPGLEAVHRVGQAGGGLGQVRRIDLFDVAQAHDLGAGAGTGDQRLHLLRGQVLRLVQNQVARQEGAPAHEVHRADLDAAGKQVVGGLAAPGAAFLGVGEHFQVVGERAHPRRHLLFLGAGQKADVLADADRGAGHDDLAVALLVHGLRQPRGQRQQGLAGAGGAEQGDEVDFRVHQRVEREVLLAVARGDAPHRVLAAAEVVDQRQRRLALGVDLDHAQFHFVLARQVQVLVRIPVLVGGQGDLVASAALVAPTAQVLVVLLPEIFRQFDRAGVKQAEIVERAVVLVVLGDQAADRRLDPQVDVLGHQDHRDFRVLLAQRQHRGQDLVVRGHAAEAAPRLDRAHLEVQPADGAGALELDALRMAERNAGFDLLGAGALDQLVEETADLARVAADFGHALLGIVQFLDHLHRQEHVVFLELEQRGRIVHQHVGIQHVDALASGHHGFLKEEQGRAIAACGAGRCGVRETAVITAGRRPAARRARPGRGREP
ncbi:hypothetical protein NB706_002947 [Xanthomonas sacchari]|nr:hypothetical protein [Xanthomonas sacchari]